MLVDNLTIIKPYGWVFFYNTRRYAETGDVLYALGGNGPVVVERETGRMSHLGTLHVAEQSIAAFESNHGLPSAP